MLGAVKTDVAIDLRGAVRFPLRLPVLVRENGTGKTHEAETENISAGGVLIRCDLDYPVGAPISFSIAMPAHIMGLKNDLKLECVGRVVRCTPVNGRMALAAIIDEYHISR